MGENAHPEGAELVPVVKASRHVLSVSTSNANVALPRKVRQRTSRTLSYEEKTVVQ